MGPWAQGLWAQENQKKITKRRQNKPGGHNFEKIIARRRAQVKTQNHQKRT